MLRYLLIFVRFYLGRNKTKSQAQNDLLFNLYLIGMIILYGSISSSSTVIINIQKAENQHIGFTQKGMPISVRHYLISCIKSDNRMQYRLEGTLSLLGESKNALDEIKRVLKYLYKPLQLFKMLILIHECMLLELLQPEKCISFLIEVKHQAKPKQHFELDQLICTRVLPTYTLYLQKCYQAKLDCSQYRTQQSQQNLFRVLNILKQGLSIVDILYIFGRYFQNRYAFFVDFNIVLARDFQQLYNVIKKNFKKNRMLWNERMKIQLEEIHEKMYVVYYNCYFHQEIKEYIPRWVDTDTNYKKMNKLSMRDKQEKKVVGRSRVLLDNSCNSIPSRSALKNISLNSTGISLMHCSSNLQKNYQEQASLYSFNQICSTIVSEFEDGDGGNQYQVVEEKQDNRISLIRSLEEVIVRIDANLMENGNRNC